MLQHKAEERKRFADFARVLLICRGVLRRVTERTQVQPTERPAAAKDVRALGGRRPEVHPRVALLIPIATETYPYAASQQIGALAALHAHDVVLMGLGSQSLRDRTLCSHTLDPRRRGRRAGRWARRPSADRGTVRRREARKQSEGLAGPDSEDHLHPQTKLEDFEAAAISMFGTPIRVKQQ